MGLSHGVRILLRPLTWWAENVYRRRLQNPKRERLQLEIIIMENVFNLARAKDILKDIPATD